MKFRGIAGRLIAALLVVLPMLPALADPSARLPVDPSGAFAKLTGLITQIVPSDGGSGNGFIVGVEGCHVLTNFHVAFGIGKDRQTGEVQIVDDPRVGHAVNFSFDLDQKTGRFKKQTRATVIEFGNYESGTSPGFLGDLALLRLDKCPGTELGTLEMDQPVASKRVPSGKLMTVSCSRRSRSEPPCRSNSEPGRKLTFLQ